MTSSSRPHALRTTAPHPAVSPRVTREGSAPAGPVGVACEQVRGGTRPAAAELRGHPAVDRARAATQHLLRTIGYQPERFARMRNDAVHVALTDGVAVDRLADALDALPASVQRMSRCSPRRPRRRCAPGGYRNSPPSLMMAGSGHRSSWPHTAQCSPSPCPLRPGGTSTANPCRPAFRRCKPTSLTIPQQWRWFRPLRSRSACSSASQKALLLRLLRRSAERLTTLQRCCTPPGAGRLLYLSEPG